MYEQSIPALAYIFIGITSLVVTYSQINQKNDTENTDVNTTQATEPVSDNIEEPEQETALDSISQENSETSEQPEDNTQPVENSAPSNESEEQKTEEENKVGGKKNKRKSKRKSTKSIKKIVKKNKRKSLRRKKSRSAKN
jgi:hypothetical protein